MTSPKPHLFRQANPAHRIVQETQRRFAAREKKLYQRWAEYRRHKRVIEDALALRLFGDQKFDSRTNAALSTLRASLPSRHAPIRDGITAGPPLFSVKPGLNIIGPPYDFALVASAGSNSPAIINNVATGNFAAVASAADGKNTYGGAGMTLFIVPSASARTLAIRPYFEWHFIYDCESHGTPTAHSFGVIGCDVSGNSSGAVKNFPGKTAELWRASSDAWDDAHGGDSGTFLTPDSEMIVSGSNYYTVSFNCQAGADSGHSLFGWSEAFLQLHCRVPFIMIEEF